MTHFYRFRSTEALLGDRNELESQQIYFASPEQLNDPMEGYKDVVWSGDKILWKNVIKNYVCSLQFSMQLVQFLGDQFDLKLLEPERKR